MHITTVGLISIKNKKLLLAFSRNKQAYYLPGGKIDAGESPGQALAREVREELNSSIDTAKLEFYMHVTADAYGEPGKVIMEQDCFIYDLDGEPSPSAEVTDLNYFSCASYTLEPAQVPGVLIVMEQLKKDGLLV
jgi:8-oxo-dGTP pyrophosphatase MutT (NUDIX family)